MSLDYPPRKPPQSERQHSVALEKHYSVGEVSEMWHLSEKVIKKIFEGEDGVLWWGHRETRHKRPYVTLRIPESVLIRVHHRRRTAAS